MESAIPITTQMELGVKKLPLIRLKKELKSVESKSASLKYLLNLFILTGKNIKNVRDVIGEEANNNIKAIPGSTQLELGVSKLPLF